MKERGRRGGAGVAIEAAVVLEKELEGEEEEEGCLSVSLSPCHVLLPLTSLEVNKGKNN